MTIDKKATVPVERVGAFIGMADDSTMLRVNRALVVFLGVAWFQAGGSGHGPVRPRLDFGVEDKSAG